MTPAIPSVPTTLMKTVTVVDVTAFVAVMAKLVLELMAVGFPEMPPVKVLKVRPGGSV